ncbi:hypothetical protein D3C73_1130270 [compost metagenome]
MNRQYRDAGTAGLLDQHCTRRGQGRLGKAPASVYPNKARRHVSHLRYGTTVHPAAGQGRDIARHTKHPVAMGTIALSAGAIVGEHAGHRCTAAVTLEDRLQQPLQVGERHAHDGVGGRCRHLKLLSWNWNGNSVDRDKNFPACDSYLSNVDSMTENIHFLFTPRLEQQHEPTDQTTPGTQPASRDCFRPQDRQLHARQSPGIAVPDLGQHCRQARRQRIQCRALLSLTGLCPPQGA